MCTGSSKEVHTEFIVYTTSIKTAVFIFPKFDNWHTLIHHWAVLRQRASDTTWFACVIAIDSSYIDELR